MDDPRIGVDAMRTTLQEVDVVNRRLGGWSGSRWLLGRRLAAAMRESAAAGAAELAAGGRGAPVSVVDLGAGSGATARALGATGEPGGRAVRWALVDLHPAVCAIAEKDGPPGAFVVRADARRLPFADGAFDFAHASLVLHHFAPIDVETVLREMKRVSRRGLVVNDLERHPIAHRAIAILTRLFARSPLVRHDGPLSVRRGFRLEEVRAWARRPGFESLGARRWFPFRLLAWSFVDGGEP